VYLAFCFTASAQSTDASLTGFVDDPTKALIPKASITAINTQTGVKTSTTTNNSGQYVLRGLIPGTYRIEIDKQGFKGIIEAGLTLHVQDVVQMNFHMAPGSMSETVTVNANGANINTADASVSTIIDRQFVENIPLNGRSLQALIELTPGVVAVAGATVGGHGELSVNGQRTEANSYMVDGVSANTGIGSGSLNTAGETPAQTALGTTQSLVSIDALQEFRIDTSTYSAEFGRTPGAQISFQTRSGTNAWHGSLFDFFRNDALDANNWFNDAANLPKTEERQNDFGGTLGGPIRIPRLYDGRNRTFFFFSYEGLRLKVPRPAFTVQVPDTNLRQSAPSAMQTLINAFPIQNGAEQGNGLALFTGSYSTPSNLDSYSIRIDHSFGDRIKVFGRYADTPANSETRNVSAAGGNSYDPANLINALSRNRLVTIGATSLFTPHISNEARFNYSYNSLETVYSLDNYGGATPFTATQAAPGISPPKYFTFIAEYLFGSVPIEYLEDLEGNLHQWNIVDSTSFSFGSHTLKFGIDYRYQSGLQGNSQLENVFVYTSPAQVTSNSALEGEAVSTGGVAPTGTFTNFSAFVQDEWKVTSRLHTSLGLRWDLNPPPTGNPQPYGVNQVSNLATLTLASAGTPLWHTDYAGFAPRVGINYQLSQNPKYATVARGGFGVFYDVGNYDALGAYSGGSVGFSSTAVYLNAAFPLTPQQQTLPAPSTNPPYKNVTASDPNLRLPYTMQWNGAIEQSLGSSQSITASYVASAGRRLLHSQQYKLGGINPLFASNGYLDLTVGGSNSSYNSLQLKYQRALSHGLQAIASYTWSHAIDDLSSNQSFFPVLLRGNADFDVRHNFAGALTYDVPIKYDQPIARALLEHWGLDLRQTATSAPPVNVYYANVVLPSGAQANVQANLVAGAPIYVKSATAPGGRLVNYSAFTQPTTGTNGNAPRNFVRGFDTLQTDLAVRREFPLHERLKLQFRAESFNLFNHPNFGSVNGQVSAGKTLFGRASSTLNNSLGGLNPLYQIGGPRSLQLALKLLF
jgi:hypothetical protein